MHSKYSLKCTFTCISSVVLYSRRNIPSRFSLVMLIYLVIKNARSLAGAEFLQRIWFAIFLTHTRLFLGIEIREYLVLYVVLIAYIFHTYIFFKYTFLCVHIQSNSVCIYKIWNFYISWTNMSI